MKIIHLKGYSEDELYNYRPTVFKNLVECAKAVITAMQQFDIEPELEENKIHMQYLLDYQTESGLQAHIDPQVGVAVHSLWADSWNTRQSFILWTLQNSTSEPPVREPMELPN